MYRSSPYNRKIKIETEYDRWEHLLGILDMFKYTYRKKGSLLGLSSSYRFSFSVILFFIMIISDQTVIENPQVVYEQMSWLHNSKN